MSNRILSTVFAAVVLFGTPVALFGAEEGAKSSAKDGGEGKGGDELKLPSFPADKSAHQTAQIDGKPVSYDATVG
ncbi:MAG TPA: hypothetical protein VNM70_02960, partial [Burkholderiales bacterium]|nr:hypothetical protein [Burkholderiales bacterium]